MNRSLTTDDSDMTGQIGTAMYVAPEINAGKVIAAYSQKVDIYSLGVIFFEMCHPPLSTGMERIKVLSLLRTKAIVLPEDFETMPMQQSYIIKWLLNHDPVQRPSSLELLQSDYLPPPQVEEAELQEMVKHTLANHTSKSYRHLIDACLSQNMDIKRDIIYDMDLPNTIHVAKKFFLKQEYVRKVTQRVFQRHGALQVPLPQLYCFVTILQNIEPENRQLF
jgi:translation initiation factor 2-alpha kinase 4